MNNDTYLKAGKLLLAVAILAIGIIHLVTGNFPLGLLPVPDGVPGRTILAYLCGLAFVSCGIMLLMKKYTYQGALLAAGILLALIVLVHLPILVMHIKDGGEWTGTFEMFGLFSGALILASTATPSNTLAATTGKKLFITGTYVFAASLLAYGVLHVVYEDYVVSVIPKWFPPQVFWSYVVTAGFFASAVSIIIQKLTRLAMLLLGLMFLIWVLALHLPRVIASPKIEPEWTSMFIALAISGVGFLTAGAWGRYRKG